MSKFLSPLKVEILDSTYAQLLEPFSYQSDLLGMIVVIPTGFIMDFESVPVVKGTSKRGGVVHDYLVRIDSNPRVTKRKAADVYLESMVCRDGMLIDQSWMAKVNRATRRRVKYWAVCAASGYMHKHYVLTSYANIGDR